MKKFRFLLALALVFTMLASVAMAADYELISDDIIYSGTGNIEVSLKSSAAGSGLGVTAELYYDSAIWSFVSSSDEENIVDTGGTVMIIPEGIAVEDNGVLLTCTFAPVDDTVDVYSDAAAFKFVDTSLFTTKGDLVKGWSKTVKVVKPAPVVNKYNVTFTGYESKNMTDVEENTEITLPAAPAVDKNKEFVGWSDGTTTYEAGAKYTVAGNVTFTAVINDITLPTPVATKEAIISAEVDGKTYTDIFEGIYTLTPGKASLTKFGVKIPGKLNPADVREFATSGTFEGEGTFVYRVALFGVMDKADIAATPFAE